MSRSLLAKALGSIASYAQARDVPAARLIFCDATAFDEGHMAPEEMAGRVKIRGRGGTMLQPGTDLLQSAEDFPDKGQYSSSPTPFAKTTCTFRVTTRF